MVVKKIILSDFLELKTKRCTVPRELITGNVSTVKFMVGSVYIISNNENKEKLKAKCIKDCPCTLVLLK